MPRTLRTSNPVKRGHPLNQGRLAWWLALPHLMGGATWPDLMGLSPASLTSMGNANNGWRATTRPGGWGRMLFDGTAGYCSGPGVPASTYAGAFAAAAWVSHTTTPTIPVAIVSSRSAAVAGWSMNTYTYNYGNYLGLSFYGVNDYGSSFSLPSGTHRMLASIRPSGGGSQLFVDGQLVATLATGTMGPPDLPGVNFGAGLRNTGNVNSYLPGSLDDVTVWSANPILSANPAAFAALDYDQSRRGYPDALNYY